MLVLYGTEWLLFYPAAGYRFRDTGAFDATGGYGYAWSCTVSGVNGYFLGFHLTSVSPTSSNNRAYGFSVRCVQNLLLVKKIKSLIRVEVSLIVKKAVTFYPASGWRSPASGAFSATGSEVVYWSCALSGVYVSFLWFNAAVVQPASSFSRARGHGVRCVQYLHQTF